MAVRPAIISLCAGGGGLDLGIQLAVPGAHSVCMVEREAYAASLLVARMEAQELAPAPVWSDLASFDARPWRDRVHIVASGDPCQPNSVAGKQRGANDDRFLIEQVVRIIDVCRPLRLFRENVTGNAAGQLAALVGPLEQLGYRVAAGIFGSAGTGASHRRERLFLMADREGGGFAELRDALEPRGGGHADRGEPRLGSVSGLGNTDDQGSQGRLDQSGECARQWAAGTASADFPLWAPGQDDPRWRGILGRAPQLEPAVRRVPDAMADRVERLRLLGNGVDPVAAAYAWCRLDAAQRSRETASAGEFAVRFAA